MQVECVRKRKGIFPRYIGGMNDNRSRESEMCANEKMNRN